MRVEGLGENGRIVIFWETKDPRGEEKEKMEAKRGVFHRRLWSEGRMEQIKKGYTKKKEAQLHPQGL